MFRMNHTPASVGAERTGNTFSVRRFLLCFLSVFRYYQKWVFSGPAHHFPPNNLCVFHGSVLCFILVLCGLRGKNSCHDFSQKMFPFQIFFLFLGEQQRDVRRKTRERYRKEWKSELLKFGSRFESIFPNYRYIAVLWMLYVVHTLCTNIMTHHCGHGKEDVTKKKNEIEHVFLCCWFSFRLLFLRFWLCMQLEVRRLAVGPSVQCHRRR